MSLNAALMMIDMFPQLQSMQKHDCALPEVFLTLGPPGESIRVPLSPVPSRPSSLALSPGQSPHPSGASPKLTNSRDPRPKPTSPCRPSLQSSPISPDDDYFSLIQRVHTTQIQKATGRGETGKGKGKGDGRKEGAKKKRWMIKVIMFSWTGLGTVCQFS